MEAVNYSFTSACMHTFCFANNYDFFFKGVKAKKKYVSLLSHAEKDKGRSVGIFKFLFKNSYTIHSRAYILPSMSNNYYFFVKIMIPLMFKQHLKVKM